MATVAGYRPAHAVLPRDGNNGRLTRTRRDLWPWRGGIATGARLQLRYGSAPTAHSYFAERVNATASRPTTGATALSLPAGLGWSTRAGDYTSVVLPLPHGQTFVLAGSAEPAQIEQLAAQISTQVDALIPLASVLPTPPGAP